ncbi:hypothetical protein DIPPA_24856 [Diplonema papillatum]|nr:hypothetical protein DIPPA_24856 [Diplonema papillatum]
MVEDDPQMARRDIEGYESLCAREARLDASLRALQQLLKSATRSRQRDEEEVLRAAMPFVEERLQSLRNRLRALKAKPVVIMHEKEVENRLLAEQLRAVQQLLKGAEGRYPRKRSRSQRKSRRSTPSSASVFTSSSASSRNSNTNDSTHSTSSPATSSSPPPSASPLLFPHPYLSQALFCTCPYHCNVHSADKGVHKSRRHSSRNGKHSSKSSKRSKKKPTHRSSDRHGTAKREKTKKSRSSDGHQREHRSVSGKPSGLLAPHGGQPLSHPYPPGFVGAMQPLSIYGSPVPFAPLPLSNPQQPRHYLPRQHYATNNTQHNISNDFNVSNYSGPYSVPQTPASDPALTQQFSEAQNHVNQGFGFGGAQAQAAGPHQHHAQNGPPVSYQPSVLGTPGSTPGMPPKAPPSALAPIDRAALSGNAVPYVGLQPLPRNTGGAVESTQQPPDVNCPVNIALLSASAGHGGAPVQQQATTPTAASPMSEFPLPAPQQTSTAPVPSNRVEPIANVPPANAEIPTRPPMVPEGPLQNISSSPSMSACKYVSTLQVENVVSIVATLAAHISGLDKNGAAFDWQDYADDDRKWRERKRVLDIVKTMPQRLAQSDASLPSKSWCMIDLVRFFNNGCGPAQPYDSKLKHVLVDGPALATQNRAAIAEIGMDPITTELLHVVLDHIAATNLGRPGCDAFAKAFAPHWEAADRACLSEALLALSAEPAADFRYSYTAKSTTAAPSNPPSAVRKKPSSRSGMIMGGNDDMFSAGDGALSFLSRPRSAKKTTLGSTRVIHDTGSDSDF